jgi:PAS domain S-box-containing protein
MSGSEKVNILLVDDQPGKLLSYEVVLRDLNENLIKALSAREALEYLLKNDIAVILIDVCMPDLDGFQLASMIREHPRFQQTAIIFVSAVLMNEVDFLRGYEMGAVDYVPVPVIPDVLRAKVRVFADLYRKTRQLEKLNAELELRVRERTAALEASTASLLESERRRSVALEAGQMGSWDWDLVTGECAWDAGQYRIFGLEPGEIELTFENIRQFIHSEDLARIRELIAQGLGDVPTFETEARLLRPSGEIRWCICAAAMTRNAQDKIVRVSGVTIDITERKQNEERQALLAREVDHRAKNALAVVQSIVRLSRSDNVSSYIAAVEGRIRALARAHTLLAQSRWQGADLSRLAVEELAPYRSQEGEKVTCSGPEVSLDPRMAQTIALALHELATNAAKHGALSTVAGRVKLNWELEGGALVLHWDEAGGPAVRSPSARGFGLKVITSSVEAQLGGTAKFAWQPDGLRCTLTVPRVPEEAVRARVATLAPRAEEAAQAAVPATKGAARVMVVEDEAVIGMMMKDMLSDIGLTVSGPFSTLAEASHAATHQEVDFAILDVNLAGEWVYPVADVLTQRGVPFIFVTGYGPDGIDSRFAHVPMFEKPIEAQVLDDLFSGSEQLPSAEVVGESARRRRASYAHG